MVYQGDVSSAWEHPQGTRGTGAQMCAPGKGAGIPEGVDERSTSGWG